MQRCRWVSAAHERRVPGTDAAARQNRTEARRDSATGVQGVQLDRRNGRPYAQIRVNGRRHFLGSYGTVQEAHAAYLHAKRDLHTLWQKRTEVAVDGLPATVTPDGRRRVRCDSKARLQGVQQGPNGKWRARLSRDGRTIHLGVFDTAEQAHVAFVAARAVG